MAWCTSDGTSFERELENKVMPSLSTYKRLYEALFPGARFTLDKSHYLATELRCIADELCKNKVKRKAIVGGKGQDVDFSRYRKRYIALDLAYKGFDYHGFAQQVGSEKTIEGELFNALKHARLIPRESTWSDIKYSRGGRTDKGVSASGQVVALEVRSKGLISEELLKECDEYDYPRILNRVLTPDIRILGWKPVKNDFSARFSAKYREYKYYFVHSEPLDIVSMGKAAAFLVGEHDFRNFCKADVPKIKNFVRGILFANIREVKDIDVPGFHIVELHIRGRAFLWHQVRCIASVLLMVGKGLEQPEVINGLLNISQVESKPYYNMASEQPLILHECHYDELDFTRSDRVFQKVSQEISEDISRLIEKVSILSSLKKAMESKLQSSNSFLPLDERTRGQYHSPLLQRAREPSIQDRIHRRGIQS